MYNTTNFEKYAYKNMLMNLCIYIYIFFIYIKISHFTPIILFYWSKKFYILLLIMN